MPLLEEAPPSSCPTPLSYPDEDDEPPSPSPSPPHPLAPASMGKRAAQKDKASRLSPTGRPTRQSPRQQSKNALAVSQPLRRSPRQHLKKKRIQLRESLEGAWKEVEAEILDMTGDGSGWKKSRGKAQLPEGWRKSGVEILDLTGA